MNAFDFIIGFITGFIISPLLLFGWFFYHYAKALKQAHEEGWDMPN